MEKSSTFMRIPVKRSRGGSRLSTKPLAVYPRSVDGATRYSREKQKRRQRGSEPKRMQRRSRLHSCRCDKMRRCKAKHRTNQDNRRRGPAVVPPRRRYTAECYQTVCCGYEATNVVEVCWSLEDYLCVYFLCFLYFCSPLYSTYCPRVLGLFPKILLTMVFGFWFLVSVRAAISFNFTWSVGCIEFIAVSVSYCICFPLGKVEGRGSGVHGRRMVGCFSRFLESPICS